LARLGEVTSRSEARNYLWLRPAPAQLRGGGVTDGAHQ